jgi:hypothetical protein
MKGKGKELSIEDVLGLKDGTQIWYDGTHYHELAYKINNKIIQVSDNQLLSFINELYGDRKVYEWIEEPKQYKGWEVLKMIDEGDLKEGSELISDYGYGYIVKKFGSQDNTLVLSNKSDSITYLQSPALQMRTFIIKEKEYLNFDEARNSNKKFKYKDWNSFMTIGDIMFKLCSDYHDAEITKLLNEKAWEVEK